MPINVGTRRALLGKSGYDPDAQDYFTRAEALGGSFNQTSISSVYTADYVKGAINQYVVSLKAQGLWNRLEEIYLLTGVSFGGLMAKLKYLSGGTATLTNNGPFVTGDYTPVGANSGLVGNGTSKFLGTTFTVTATRQASIGAYLTVADVGSSTTIYIGAGPIAGTGRFIGEINGGVLEAFQSGTDANSYTGTVVPRRNGFLIGAEYSSSSRAFYRNGALLATNSFNSTFVGGWLLKLYAYPDAGTFYSSARIGLGFSGLDLTAGEILTMTTTTNNLMTAFAANVY